MSKRSRWIAQPVHFVQHDAFASDPDDADLWMSDPPQSSATETFKKPFRVFHQASLPRQHAIEGLSDTALSVTATARGVQHQDWRSAGKTAARHTSAEFVAFLTDIVANQPRGKDVHVIPDNLSAHKSQPVKDFLEAHKKVSPHFTPTYSSWLNQGELWFPKIERDVIARSAFTSVPDLKRKLMRYIRQYNKAPKTVKWKFFDRTITTPAVTAH